MAILDDATRIRLRADVPWGAFLSGGVDSSTIVGLMARHVRPAGQDLLHRLRRPALRRVALRAEAARRFGCDHTSEIAELNMLDRWPQVLYHLDQPHGDASFMPTLRVSELAARHVKVVLTGDGGDELFAGYDKYAAFFGRPDAQTMPAGRFPAQLLRFDLAVLAAKKADLYQPAVARSGWTTRQFRGRRARPSMRPRTSTGSTRRCTSTCSCCCPATTWSSPTAWAWPCRSRRARLSWTGG